MTPDEAIGILRNPAPWINDDAQSACKMGADALEAWAWVGKEEHNVLCNIQRKRWEVDSGVRVIGHGPTPLSAVLDAMQKEKG